MSPAPALRVVIPTHQRRESLLRTLAALAAQTALPDEVVVVADGCTDGTAEAARAARWPFPLAVVEQPASGAAAARNAGAARAGGGLLLFLDDDVEASSGLVAAHLRAHQAGMGDVVLGPSLPDLGLRNDYFAQRLRAWWHEVFSQMARPGHRFTFRDLMTGNLSLPAAQLAAVGGFDAALPCREDFELGVRLLAAGARFAFAADAVGRHHDATDLDRSLQRARQEGRGDVAIARRHPDLAPELNLAGPFSPGERSLVFDHPALGALLAPRLRYLLDVLEAARLRRHWRGLYGELRSSEYLRGAADELGGINALGNLFAPLPPFMEGPASDLDLREGLASLERRLDRERPSGVRLRYGMQPVGTIPAKPGAEPLRGAHLRRALAEELVTPLVAALVIEGTVSGQRTGAGLFTPEASPATGRVDEPWPAMPDTSAGPEPRLSGFLLPLEARTGDLSKARCTSTSFGRQVPAESGRLEVGEIDLAAGVEDVPLADGAAGARMLVRWEGEPLGWLDLRGDGDGIAAGRLRAEIARRLGADLATLVLARELGGEPAPGAPEPLPPPATVVVCTRDRAGHLEGCLAALLALDHPDYEVVVVDNAPGDDATARLAARLPVRYVREPRPGLDWARNRGIAEARHGIVAFTDDDARPDRLWLRTLAGAFADPEVAAATGLVAPAALATQAERYFELVYGGMGKGMRRRDFRRDRLSAAGRIGIFAAGVGANMAFRRGTFERLGGFDTALDVGTPARGGGDLEMFHRVVAAGLTLRYEPAALVWHRHRSEIRALRRQLEDDGRSFGVYLLRLWREGREPGREIARYALLRWLPWLAGRLALGLLGRHRLPLPLLWAGLRGALGAPRAYRATLGNDRRLREAMPAGPILAP